MVSLVKFAAVSVLRLCQSVKLLVPKGSESQMEFIFVISRVSLSICCVTIKVSVSEATVISTSEKRS